MKVREDRSSLAEPLLKEVGNRLDYLHRVGVGYVELNRPVWTLSGERHNAYAWQVASALD